MRSRTRSMITALFLFCGINTTMGTLGALIFDDAVLGALYGTGVVAGAGYVSTAQYRADRRED
jgi:hypothetical protein